MDRILVIMWCDYGIEAICDLTNYEQIQEEKVFATLAGDELPEDNFPDLTFMKLRARYNTPRNYKIYGVKLPGEYTDDIIEKNWQALDI